MSPLPNPVGPPLRPLPQPATLLAFHHRPCAALPGEDLPFPGDGVPSPTDDTVPASQMLAMLSKHKFMRSEKDEKKTLLAVDTARSWAGLREYSSATVQRAASRTISTSSTRPPPTGNLWGVASFLAPPSESSTPRASAASPGEGEKDEEVGNGDANGLKIFGQG
ncbi:hypothetical protein PVAP13_9KG296313 [Panicum virgatum]|uniref:Uncharacterized protein n=1 Tax=Panicum virgatum TaxID=38727 RepID=A0A8T0NR21_PANVG|nr:hypothetical protein PVAP13_9KG296313 [Panicum virgatum]